MGLLNQINHVGRLSSDDSSSVPVFHLPLHFRKRVALKASLGTLSLLSLAAAGTISLHNAQTSSSKPSNAIKLVTTPTSQPTESISNNVQPPLQTVPVTNNAPATLPSSSSPSVSVNVNGHNLPVPANGSSSQSVTSSNGSQTNVNISNNSSSTSNGSNSSTNISVNSDSFGQSNNLSLQDNTATNSP